ncbi:phosphotransferase enzyme family protein [Hazenella coriacea]|nr:phosphotransferase [Hazenella coriacea]
MNPQILRKIAQSYGVDESDLDFHKSTESFLYRYEKQGTPFFLRISHSSRRTPDMIRGELDWLQWLEQHQLPVVRVASTPDQETCVVVELDDGTFFTAVSFHQLPGKQMNRLYDNNQLVQQLGSLMAKLHLATQTYSPRYDSWKRHHWSQELHGFAEKYLSPTERKVIERFNSTMEEISSLPQTSDNYGLIHYDLHPGNIFVDDHQLVLLDFDDSQYSWFMSDLAISLFYAIPFSESEAKKTESAKRFLDQLLTGYQQIRSINDRELGWIPLFLKLREIDLYIVIHRSFGAGSYNEWCQTFMKDRKERIENKIPMLLGSYY